MILFEVLNKEKALQRWRVFNGLVNISRTPPSP
jgi:hypothetical protein